MFSYYARSLDCKFSNKIKKKTHFSDFLYYYQFNMSDENTSCFKVKNMSICIYVQERSVFFFYISAALTIIDHLLRTR